MSRAAAAALAAFLLAASPGALAQFKVQDAFTQTTAPGWTLANNAYLTATTIDPPGSGWLRLTDTAGNEKGEALYTGGSFAGAQSLVVKFSYVAWGGTGADGITVYLYDSTQAMTGATNGGGLGYCGGAGGYLAIGLDEYGNFSNPADKCGAASGGPGAQPDRLVIRGPLTANDIFIANTAVPGGIDYPGAATRPTPNTVLVVLTPAGIGFNVTVEFQNGAGATYQTLMSNVSFPYAPPASLSIGFSGSTGGSTNTHEVQNLSVASPADLQVGMTAPAFVTQGNTLGYSVTVTNNGPVAIDLTNSPTLVDAFPAGLTGITWTCAGSGGATCPASGSGNINTTSLVLPVNGTATFSVTATASASAACGTTLTNSANADFGASAGFTDTNPNNNTATGSTFVVCIVPQADTGTAAAGTASSPIANVAANDSVNGATATLGGAGNATVANVGSYPAGVALDTTSGAITTTAAALPGVDALQYQLCDKKTPAHCATTTATVTINAVITPVADNGTAAAGTASTPIANVAANDTVNGQAATLGASGNATLSSTGSYPAGLALNTTSGAITMTAAVAPGVYALQYQLCDKNTPVNCASGTATVTVNAVITPVADSGTAAAGTASTPIANVGANDTVNGQAATLGAAGNSTVAAVGSFPAGITLNTTSGAVTTTAAVAPGSYALQYQLCDKNTPANCATAALSVTVNAAILPQPDSGSGSAGTASTPIASVVSNDTVNGQPAALGAGGNATLATVGAYPAGIALNTGTGAVTYSTAVPPGVYALQYQLCDKNAPVNCANSTATITVNAVISAQPYSATVPAGTASTAVPNVAANDSVNGQPATLGAGGNATVAAVGSYPAGIALNTTSGAVTTTAAVPPGTDALQYQLCDKNTPANCATATVTLTVAGAIVPQPDSGAAASGTASTPIANVAANDSVNGQPATLGAGGNATLASVGAYPAGLALAIATGAVSMTAAVGPGTYVLQYKLCDKSAPPNCATSTATVTVSAVITPQADAGTTTAGTAGIAVANVAANDTLNGHAAALGAGGNATVAAVGAYPPGIALNATTGAIAVAASVDPGAYAVQYQLCDRFAPPDCASSTATITVIASIIAQPVTGTVPDGSAATAIANVVATDTVNGQPAVLGASGDATVAPSGAYPAGIALNPATGALTVAASVAPGSYPVQFQLCDKSTPPNCAVATATVIVSPPAQISIAKAVGVPRQVGAASFEVPYTVLAGNAGSAGLIAYDVQANDDLALAFPGTSSVGVKAGSLAVTATGGGSCTANAAFNGAGDTRLLAGSDSLGSGAACIANFIATVSYANLASIPKSAQSNFAYASATPPGAGPNPGFSFPGGAPTAPGNALSTAASVAGAGPVAGAPPGTVPPVPPLPPGGNTSGTPTRVTLVAGSASISGAVWNDAVGPSAGNRQYTTGKPGLAGWTVELINPATGQVASLASGAPATATTDANGAYQLGNAIPGSYVVEFCAPGSTTAWGVPVNGNNNNPQPNSLLDPSSHALDVTLLSGATLAQQSLPVDPTGVVYDSASRTPLPGATVTLVAPNGSPVPASNLLAGQQGQVTGASGAYRFDLLASAPSGVYTIRIAPPAGYLFPSVGLPPQAGALPLQPGPAPFAVATGIPAAGQPAKYYLALTLAPASNAAAIVENDVPLDSTRGGVLLVDKLADKTQAEVGDSLRYRIRARNTGSGVILGVQVQDTLPLGFALIPGTVLIGRDGALPTRSANPQGTPGPRLSFALGNLGPGESIEIDYRVRIGVGADRGDGINRAQALGGNGVASLVASARVLVTGGAFTTNACVLGKVYVDCNGNRMQDAGEPGIPGVRLYFEDGTNLTTDENGNYSICGLRPITHALKVDPSSLPAGSRLVELSSRNAGNGDSLFVDLRDGELHRADFAEGSCTDKVMEQVKQRRAHGAVLAPLTPSHPDHIGLDVDSDGTAPLPPCAAGITPSSGERCRGERP